MSNPWEEIDLSDYENHMSLDSVYQLQVLNDMMKTQFDAYEVDTAMVLGIAGGNGLEHVCKEKFQRVYGVDVNSDFLVECQKRHPDLENVFTPLCVDLRNDDLQLPHSELLVANLLIEYVGYDCFQKVVRLVVPQYVSCIIQINTDDSFVSDSPYIHVFDGLEEVHHQMEKTELIKSMEDIGYKKNKEEEKELPNGKKLVRIDFGK